MIPAMSLVPWAYHLSYWSVCQWSLYTHGGFLLPAIAVFPWSCRELLETRPQLRSFSIMSGMSRRSQGVSSFQCVCRQYLAVPASVISVSMAALVASDAFWDLIPRWRWSLSWSFCLDMLRTQDLVHDLMLTMNSCTYPRIFEDRSCISHG